MMYTIKKEGELKYLYSHFTELAEGWKYRGIPIFLTKKKERLVYTVYYGNAVFTTANLSRMMTIIDSICDIYSWRTLLPERGSLGCPVCSKRLKRESLFLHYTRHHFDGNDGTEAAKTFNMHFSKMWGSETEAVDLPSQHMREYLTP